jgi:uncharacterized protein YhbP (UPF0306 family)
MNSVQELAKKYLDQVFVMQLATCADGQPWCCTVHFVADDNFNLYWISAPQRRHSKELANNPKAAAAIAMPETAGKVRGVQIQGTVRKVTDPQELAKLIAPYEKRFGRHGVGAEIAAGTNPHQLYQLRPDSIVLFDNLHFPDDPRQEWTPHA